MFLFHYAAVTKTDPLILPHMPILFDCSWEKYYLLHPGSTGPQQISSIITISPLLLRPMLSFNPAEIPSAVSQKKIRYYLFPL